MKEDHKKIYVRNLLLLFFISNDFPINFYHNTKLNIVHKTKTKNNIPCFKTFIYLLT